MRPQLVVTIMYYKYPKEKMVLFEHNISKEIVLKNNNSATGNDANG